MIRIKCETYTRWLIYFLSSINLIAQGKFNRSCLACLVAKLIKASQKVNDKMRNYGDGKRKANNQIIRGIIGNKTVFDS